MGASIRPALCTGGSTPQLARTPYGHAVARSLAHVHIVGRSPLAGDVHVAALALAVAVQMAQTLTRGAGRSQPGHWAGRGRCTGGGSMSRPLCWSTRNSSDGIALSCNRARSQPAQVHERARAPVASHACGVLQRAGDRNASGTALSRNRVARSLSRCTLWDSFPIDRTVHISALALAQVSCTVDTVLYRPCGRSQPSRTYMLMGPKASGSGGAIPHVLPYCK